jgi:hypothetical protein
MNQDQRTTIRSLSRQLGFIVDSLQKEKDKEEAKEENLSLANEGLEWTALSQQIRDAYQCLDDAIDSLESAMNRLDEI